MTHPWRIRLAAALALSASSIGGAARAQNPPPPPVLPAPADAVPPAQGVDPNEPAEDPNVQVLTQGPLHEAFAEPVLFEPKPGPVVPQPPPDPIEEVPPDTRPEGDNVQWIPGYWAWDDDRGTYLWVSGLWRAIPPGQQWVPGYWNSVEGGVQWVPGYWASADAQQQAQYLPAPPPSLENGPSSPPPSEGAVWVPGNWVWVDDRYAWQPGTWVEQQPGWVWTPAQYAWTPGGYVYNQGFWDYPIANRGMPFAPVAFTQPIYRQPGFRFTPGVGLLTSSLLSSLFVRPAYGSYYFGDYYAANNFNRGIYPYYAFHQSRYGYDPIYANAVARYGRQDPQWAQKLHETYAYRREHAEARPPHTYGEFRRIAARPATGAASPAAALAAAPLARPLRQLASAPAGGNQAMRFVKVDEARRQEMAKRSAEVHQFRQERMRREVQAAKAQPQPGNAPRRIEMPRSPVVAQHLAHAAPPAAPVHPRANRDIPPPARDAAPIRHEPHPGMAPPPHQGRPNGPGRPDGARPPGRPEGPDRPHPPGHPGGGGPRHPNAEREHGKPRK